MPSSLGSSSPAAVLQEALENSSRLIDKHLQEDRCFPDLSELLNVPSHSKINHPSVHLWSYLIFYLKNQWVIISHVSLCLADMPSLSGMSDMDYPLQGSGLISVPSLPELGPVRRVPLPAELVEQFGRILPIAGCLNETFI